MRGQIFSVDFVMGIAILSLGLAIALQTIDLAQRTSDQYAIDATNEAEMLAQNITQGGIGATNTTPYCLSYTNQSVIDNGCRTFPACAERIFTAHRLVECNPPATQPCILEVRTCA